MSDGFELAAEYHSMRTVRVDELHDVETNEPLLIKGAVSGSRAFSTWDFDTLGTLYGSLVCQVSDDSRPGYNQKARFIHEPLREYLSVLDHDAIGGHARYLFHTFQTGAAVEDLAKEQLVSDVVELLELLGFERQAFRFYVGPRFTGALPHMHGSAANALVRGRKRWAVYGLEDDRKHAQLVAEAYAAYPPGSFVVDWFGSECDRLRTRGVPLWECIQEPGDVVAVPGGMLHAVINLTSVIGLVTEELDD